MAEAALQEARTLLPGDARPLVGIGGVQLGRHEFASALRTGEAALGLDPSSVSAGAIVVDSLIELGRYDEAFVAVEGLVEASTDLVSLSRLSYTRELRGDLAGALSAMERAVDSAGPIPENAAFAWSIVGHLQGLNGDRQAARAAYGRALSFVPDHGPSLAGLGRLAIGEGDLDGAIGYFEQAAAIVPLAEYAIALGEIHETQGAPSKARRQYDLARAELQLSQASGVVVDTEFAIFEADHGDPPRALELAEQAYANAPTVRAADALAWALQVNDRDEEARRRSTEALRLGSREPLFQYHAGVIDAKLGRFGEARRHLEAALGAGSGFSAAAIPELRRLLSEIPAGS